MLLVITFIDIDHQIIPDILSVTGIPLFFLLGFLVPFITWKDALIGILAGGGLLYAVAFGYQMLTGRDGMGGGDIKLLAMIGAMIGWQGILFTVFVSSLSGTVIGLLLALPAGRSMKSRLPFGPFLAAGAIAYLFCGPALIRWYIGFCQHHRLKGQAGGYEDVCHYFRYSRQSGCVRGRAARYRNPVDHRDFQLWATTSATGRNPKPLFNAWRPSTFHRYWATTNWRSPTPLNWTGSTRWPANPCAKPVAMLSEGSIDLIQHFPYCPRS